MIDFELSPLAKEIKNMWHDFNLKVVRKITRYYDEYEHEHDEMSEEEIKSFKDIFKAVDNKIKKRDQSSEGEVLLSMVVSEERSWGASIMGAGAIKTGLGNAAINAVATDEQKARFGHLYASMAITEPGCGSDTAAVSTTAKLDPETNEWILNGEKIFVTSGDRSESVVVWATLDKSKGRPAIKSFVVEKDRPGITVTKLENKLGIRCSDTASIVFEDCRIPYDNILGSPEIKEKKGGIRGVMATFDATRPGVAAGAIGVARAALDFTKEKLEEEGFNFPYDRSIHELTAIQRDILDMEADLDVARLLTWNSAAMIDRRLRNSKEASCGKAKAGKVASDQLK